MGKLIGKGFGGILPAAIARSAQRDAAEEERQAAIAASAQGQPMKKGGKVSASSRADGCVTKGHTKGRIV
jgi:putative hemolysin